MGFIEFLEGGYNIELLQQAECLNIKFRMWVASRIIWKEKKMLTL